MPTTIDLSERRDEIKKLYLDEGYSAKSVAEILSESGFPVCQITLLRYLKKEKLVKKRGTPGFCAKAKCGFCSNEYMRTNPRHKWCTVCVPERKMAYLITRFGINAPQFNAMLATQNNACKICKRSFEKHKTCVDHCHKTGRVRGILCNRCNVGLGHVETDGWLSLALSYIEQS